ncbi:MAG: hypothetical protein EOO85_22180, partial [Pedobacter sp.]
RLLVNIWFRPSETLQFILSNCPDKYVLALIVLGGITRSVSRAFAQNGVHPSDSKIIAAITVGALSGWLTTYCYTVALSAVGRLLGGSADSGQFRTVVAWAMVPNIGELGLLALSYNLLRPDLINPANLAPYWNYIELAINFTTILLVFWTITICLKGISILQGSASGTPVFVETHLTSTNQNGLVSIQIGAVAARTLVFLPLLLIVLWAFDYRLSANNLTSLIILLPISGVLNFLINSIISMLSFWLNGSYAFVQVKETLFWILSGALIPLDFLAPAFTASLKFFPPAYVVYYPVRLFMGKSIPLPVIAGSILCLGIFLLIYGLIMRQGLKKFQSHGG